MKRTALALGAVGTALLSGGVYVATRTLSRQAAGPDGDGPEPSRCLSEATIQVTATPSSVTWPDPTVVKWSVGLPNLCGNVRVRLNGESVGTSGSRSIIAGAELDFSSLPSARRIWACSARRALP